MRRTLRRAARLLVAAGALGLAQQALAEAPASEHATPVNAAPATPGQAQLEAMKVELAWLADLTTFGHHLEARVTSAGLEVCGAVPDPAVKQRALQVARQNCFLPVVDGLTVEPPGTAQPAAALQGAAADLRDRTLGERAAHFEVRAQEDGRITVRGTVGSVEDKLAVSRCLTQLAGCTCVVNLLGVTPVLRAGHLITLVTNDGAHAVSGALPSAPPPARTAAAADPEPTLPRVSHSAVVPFVLPPAPTPTIPSGLPPQRSPLVNGEADSAGVIRPMSYGVYSGQPGYASPSTPGTAPAPAGAAGSTVYPGAPAEQPRPSLWSRITAARANWTRPPSAPYSVVPAQGSAATTEPAPPVSISPSNWPPAYNMRPVAQAATAGQRLTPVPSTPEPPVIRVAGRRPAPAPAAPAVLSPSRMHKLVQGACGSLARKVQVTLLPDRTLLVHVEPANPAAERQLTDRLLQLPEITTPGIRLEVAILP